MEIVVVFVGLGHGDTVASDNTTANATGAFSAPRRSLLVQLTKRARETWWRQMSTVTRVRPPIGQACEVQRR
jgi:hypothetical protein